MKPTKFHQLVSEKFASLCETYDLKITKTGGYFVRFDGPVVFLTVAYDVFRSLELVMSFGQKAGNPHAVEPPFQLSELLRCTGHYEVPEAQLQEIVARPEEIGSALEHLADILTVYGQAALRGDRNFYRLLYAQRDLDCDRYADDRALEDASRAAIVAWARGQSQDVVALLEPFRDRLTLNELHMLNASKARLPN